jgi:hypothetical protein
VEATGSIAGYNPPQRLHVIPPPNARTHTYSRFQPCAQHVRSGGGHALEEEGGGHRGSASSGAEEDARKEWQESQEGAVSTAVCRRQYRAVLPQELRPPVGGLVSEIWNEAVARGVEPSREMEALLRVAEERRRRAVAEEKLLHRHQALTASLLHASRQPNEEGEEEKGRKGVGGKGSNVGGGLEDRGGVAGWGGEGERFRAMLRGETGSFYCGEGGVDVWSPVGEEDQYRELVEADKHRELVSSNVLGFSKGGVEDEAGGEGCGSGEGKEEVGITPWVYGAIEA